MRKLYERKSKLFKSPNSMKLEAVKNNPDKFPEGYV